MESEDSKSNVCLPLKVGQFFSQAICLDADSVQRFATLIGDLNPLHHDKEVAKKSRFGGLIASGSHVSSLLTGMVASKLCGLRPSLGLEMTFQFKQAVLIDVQMVAKWTLIRIEPKERLKGDIVTFSGELIAPDGSLLVSGTVISLVN